MSKRSLTDEEVERIRDLFYTEKYTKTELANKFHCTITTIALWLPIEEEVRLNKFHSNKKHEPLCKRCGKQLKTHLRCALCTRLLHNNDKCCEI